MNIYTKTGDQGTTSLYGGGRVSKNNLRVESYGTIDELNAQIGMIKDQNIDAYHQKNLLKIQNELFTIGAMLASPTKNKANSPEISQDESIFLEKQIDLMNDSLPKMTHFILPGGHQIVSLCHIARCVCRRAERLTVSLHEHESVDPNILVYLNRLSDYLFVLARKLSKELNVDEIKWIPQPK